MSKKIYCLILAILAVSSTATPLHAKIFRYSDEAPYDTTSKLIKKVLSTQITAANPVASAELQGYNIYNAFIVALEIMQESSIVTEVEHPMIAPDQSMFFIPYFPQKKPNKLHFIVLHRLPYPKRIALYNFDESGFNEFTFECYQTHFHYVSTKKAMR